MSVEPQHQLHSPVLSGHDPRELDSHGQIPTAQKKLCESKQTTTDTEEAEICYISFLPYEIRTMIVLELEWNPRDFLNCYIVSKHIFCMLDPENPDGRRMWMKLREKNGFPNPSLVNKTDVQVFEILYSSSCDFCGEKLYGDRVYWELKGHRFCIDCFLEHTISASSLSELDSRQYSYLPCERRYSYYDSYDDLYLKTDILEYIPSESEIIELEQKKKNISEFSGQFTIAKQRLELNEDRLRELRENQIRKFLQKKFPYIDEAMLSYLPSFSHARKLISPFSDKKSQETFSDQIEKDVAASKEKLLKLRFEDVFNANYDYNALRDFGYLPAMNDVVRSAITVPTKEEALELLQPVFKVYDRHKVQMGWLDMYAKNWPSEFERRLTDTEPFISGDPRRTEDIKEIVKVLGAEVEEYYVRYGVRIEWKRRFIWVLPFEEIRQAVASSEPYLSGQRERENEVIDIFESAKGEVRKRWDEFAGKWGIEKEKMWKSVVALAASSRIQTTLDEMMEKVEGWIVSSPHVPPEEAVEMGMCRGGG